MENQTISNRYIKLTELLRLLRETFGKNFKVEVSLLLVRTLMYLTLESLQSANLRREKQHTLSPFPQNYPT